jgi:hypothetical protein
MTVEGTRQRDKRGPRARDVIAAVAQYGLLGGFTAVAAGISAQGLTGFARDSMGLRGLWPYLLFFALDGAAGVCAVLLMRRAARAEPALAPRLAVWGLVAASSAFNGTHAPHHPAAREAFALMPVIAATLFEFSLRETVRQTQRAEGGADRRLTGLRWLHPVERIRVQMQLAADPQMSAEAATRRVRVDAAARRLFLLRKALQTGEQPMRGAALTPGARRAERRAQAALTRAGFAAPGVAAEVLRQVQVLTLTPALARLDYATADAARTALGNLITPSPDAVPPVAQTMTPATAASLNGAVNGGMTSNSLPRAARVNGQPAVPASTRTDLSEPAARGQPGNGGSTTFPGNQHPAPDPDPGPGEACDRDGPLVQAAAGIVAEAARQGVRLSQTALAGQLRAQGYSIANDRLPWLSAASGLEPHRDPG